ncbi:ankyrin repeat-containing domain protein [Irpex rosettiformis]|uniref:Ankyrin repeat-containing domain protein n=1 Tax=Irpex rosettiformis TaxID=378272 RepID=A0ACB8UKU6_9APHY|nr:ankyrin repeat-containing domain protein [Irpex rosettiformis]
MSSYEPSSSFQDAAAYLSNATALSNVSNTVKLELYGLFKFLTVSPTPTSSRPSIFDFAGRAKWDAWSAVGKSYANQPAEAERRYLDIAQGLRWEEGAGEIAKVEKAQKSQSEGGDDEDIWDKDDASSSTRSNGAGVMGNAMSTMAVVEQTEQEEESLHSLARAGNVDGFKVFLDSYPGIDVNARDENGYTPLHLASDRGCRAMVEALLSAGADSSIKDEDEFTALELARVAEHGDVVALLEKL